MPRLPVYLPGWESGWKPGSSGGDSGGWSYSWKHCMLRGSRAFLPRESVLYIMYFFTFGGFFLYNFNKDCKQRLRLWFFFNFILFYFFLPLKYWLNLCLGALVFYIVAKGTPTLYYLWKVIIIQIPVCLMWRWSSCGCQPFVFQWCYFCFKYFTEISRLANF